MTITVRYLGLDLGTTNSRLCITRFNASKQQFDEPEAVRYGPGPTVRSLLLLDAAEQHVVEFGEAVYQHPHYMQHPGRVYEEFKLGLGEDPRAALCTQKLAQQLMDGLKRMLNVTGPLPASEFQTAVGTPADWLRNKPQRVEAVVRAVEAVGFPAVRPVAEPVAAMLYHAFLGDIRFERRVQRWLVVDFGGGTIDLAFVETEEGGAHPKVQTTFGRAYGGKDFDQLILEQHLLPRYCSRPPSNVLERLELLRFVRGFKEKFSEHLSNGQDEHKANCRLPGVTSPVRLTREEFESDELGRAMIDRFSAILWEGFMESGLGIADIDRVILTGGSARWYFVREEVEGLFGSQATVMSANPELTISKGLALAHTDFKAPVWEEPPPDERALTVVQQSSLVAAYLDAIELYDVGLEGEALDLEACRQKARSTVHKYMAGGAGFALLVAPVPFLAQIPLTGAEIKMVTDIAKIYRYLLKKEEVGAIIGGLVAGGALLRVGVSEVAGLVPGLGWVVKPAVAGVAIKALGEAAIKFFDERRQRGLPVKETDPQ